MLRSFGLKQTASLIVVLLLVLGFYATLELIPQTSATSNATGIGSWTEQTDYGASSGSSGSGGTSILGNSCVANAQYVYCVGGQNSQGKDLSNVYYASMSSSGTLGGWTETTDYGAASGSSGTGGVGIEFTSCVAYNGYIYCVAGATPSIVSDVFFAQLSSNGVGAWTETTDYGAASGTTGSGGVAAFELSCIADSGYIYCLGGGSSKVFYAPLSSSGVGAWTETTDYGAASGSSGSGGVSIADNPNSCVDNNGFMYCVGGNVAFVPSSQVFYAQVGSTGVGAWTEAVDYGASSGSTGSGGVPVYATSCVDYTSAIYCVGGDTTGHASTSNVYYGPVDALGAWIPTVGYLIATYHLSCTILKLLGLGWLFCTGGSSSKTGSGSFGGGGQTTAGQTTAGETTVGSCDYTAQSNGNWQDAGIWTPTPVSPFPQTLPAGCKATIPAGITVTIPLGIVIQNLGDVEISGVLANLGTFDNSGTTNVNSGGLISNNAEYSGGGIINNNNGGAINVNSGGTVNNYGLAVYYGFAAINCNSGSLFTIESGGNVNNLGGETNVNNGGTLTNAAGGTFSNGQNPANMQPGRVYVMSGGTMNNDKGATANVNAGFIEVQTGGTGNNLGTINVAAGASLSSSGTFVNPGTISSSGHVDDLGGNFVNSAGGSITLTGKAAYLDVLGGGFLSNGVLNDYGTITNNGGQISAAGKATLNINSGGSIVNSGLMEAGSGFADDSGTTINNMGTIKSTGTIKAQSGATFNNAGTLTSSGTIKNDFGTPGVLMQGIFSNSGSLTSTGNIDNLGAFTNTGQITNSGLMKNERQGTITNSAGATITNTGLIVNYGGNFNDDGTINNQAGGQFESISWITNEYGGAVASQLNLGGGVFNNDGTLTNGGVITIDSDGTLTNQANGIVLNTGAINSTGKIQNLGSITNSGHIAPTGTFTGNAPAVGVFGVPTITATCSPSTVVTNSTATCTSTITGGSGVTDGEEILFSTNSTSGTFSSNAVCSLSSNSCSLTYQDSSANSTAALIDALYLGDSKNSPGGGVFLLTVKAQVTTTSITSTTSTSSTSSLSTPPATSTTSTTSSSSSGGIPEFPVQPLLVLAFSVITVVAYLSSRRKWSWAPDKPALRRAP